MLRRLLLVLCILVFAVVVYAQPPAPVTQVVSINLTIPAWTSVDWQDYDIVFASSGTTYDYWSATLQGVAYANPPDGDGKMYATEPWTGDHWYAPTGLYWESRDGARVFLRSNCGLTMSVVPSGDLTTTQCGGNTLSTYYTVCGTSDIPGFKADGNIYTGGNPPSGYNGQYLDAGFDFNLVPAAGNVYPTQAVFAMTGPNQSLVMTNVVYGTFKFLARVHRDGMLDCAGLYSASLTVTITQP